MKKKYCGNTLYKFMKKGICDTMQQKLPTLNHIDLSYTEYGRRDIKITHFKNTWNDLSFVLELLDKYNIKCKCVEA